MYKRIHTLLLLVLLSCKSSFIIQASETTELYSEYYNSPEAVPEPQQEIPDSEGKPLMLLQSEIEMIPVTGRKRQVDSQIIYKGIDRTDKIPEQAVVRVEDKEAGVTFDAQLPLTAQNYENERWESFTFKVTFHAYGSDRYRLGEREIQIGTGQPELTDVEEEILALIGMDRENCRIDRYEWNGENYHDTEGNNCRDALGFAERRVWDCKALYGQETVLPDYKQYRRRSIYGGAVGETGSFEVKEPEVGAEAQEEYSQPESLWNRLLKVIRRHLHITIGAGLILVFLAGLWILRLLARKAQKERG